MDRQEQFDKLSRRLSETGQKFLEADKRLSQEKGFIPAEILSEYAQSKHDWQLASNDYHTFLAMIVAEDKVKD